MLLAIGSLVASPNFAALHVTKCLADTELWEPALGLACAQAKRAAQGRAAQGRAAVPFASASPRAALASPCASPRASLASPPQASPHAHHDSPPSPRAACACAAHPRAAHPRPSHPCGWMHCPTITLILPLRFFAKIVSRNWQGLQAPCFPSACPGLGNIFRNRFPNFPLYYTIRFYYGFIYGLLFFHSPFSKFHIIIKAFSLLWI